jgi:hypothetical protein
MTYHGRNSGGTWDAQRHRASYQLKPDKESPLWDTRSRVIYWWTSSEVDQEKALTATYNGQTLKRPKTSRSPTIGFRAVRAQHDTTRNLALPDKAGPRTRR